MAIYALKLNSVREEVYQVETDVEVTIPAQIDYEIFEGAIGFNIKMPDDEYEKGYDFTLTSKGMEELIKFYNEHKNKLTK